MRMRFTAFCVAMSLLAPRSICWDINMDEARMMAKCLWGECRGIESTMERAAVAWTILNRVDDARFPDTIPDVIGQPNQFTGYKWSNPVDPELLDLAMDVIVRWYREKDGEEAVGRVLPSEYVFFVGRSGRNYFSDEWPVSGTWDWSLEDPYVTEYIGEEEEQNNDDFSESQQFMDEYRRFDDGVLRDGTPDGNPASRSSGRRYGARRHY